MITKIPKLTKAAQDAAIEMEPKLYNVVGVTLSGNKIATYAGIHYTHDEAMTAFKERIGGTTGVAGSSWNIRNCDGLSAAEIEKHFTEHADRIMEEKKIKKNALMQEILRNKDIELLHRNYTRFSKEEVEYLHNEIIKK